MSSLFNESVLARCSIPLALLFMAGQGCIFSKEEPANPSDNTLTGPTSFISADLNYPGYVYGVCSHLFSA